MIWIHLVGNSCEGMTAAVIDMAKRNQCTRNFPEFSNDKEICH